MFTYQRVDSMNFSPDFLTNTLRGFNEPETMYWQKMDFSVPNPTVFHYPVYPGTEEANEILDFIYANTKTPTRCRILKVTRIQNPFLMVSYLINKDMLRRQYGLETVYSNFYLHGTPMENIPDISVYNFDLLSVQRSRYGKGIYFTPDVGLARLFCDKNSYEKEMVFAYVLQSSECLGHKDMVVPIDGADTSMNVTDWNTTVIVKYDDDTFYPAYRIVFTYD